MSRISVRDFIADKVPSSNLIHEILQTAKQNLGINPTHIEWKVYVLEGAKLKSFVQQIQQKLDSGYLPVEQEYNVYPPKLKLEYHKRRKQLAVDMYKLLQIPYKDKLKRLQHLKRNWSFFGAPIGLLFTMKKQSSNPSSDHNDMWIQYCYLGMYIQQVMILLQQHGIDSCAQEAWANLSKTIHEMLHIDRNELLFCGMSVGYRTPDAAVNTLRSERMKLNDFVQIKTAKL